MKSNSIPQSLKAASLVAAVAFVVWHSVDWSSPRVPNVALTRATSASSATDSLASAPAENAVAIPAVTEQANGANALLFSKPKNITGQSLDLKGKAYFNAQIHGEHITGRVANVDAASFAALTVVQEGDAISFPTFDGAMSGTVEVAVDEDGWHRIGGPLSGGKAGWFSFGFNGSDAVGLVRLTGDKVAYDIRRSDKGVLQMTERPLNDLACLSMPRFDDGSIDTGGDGGIANPWTHGPVAKIDTPILNSRPGAPAAIYLNFDGAVVKDPDWGNITARASALTSVQRQDVWRRVKEDFLPFNINVTTDPNEYDARPAGMRMRCIITPDDTAGPGSGGVSFVGSFHYAGIVFKGNCPCWVFNKTPKPVADAVSHEVGHSLGLYHDGLYVKGNGRAGFFEYYFGHGSGPTSWGPIMGAPYTRSVQQWSRGEYTGANRFEDDIEIIAGTLNGFGYAADDFGDTPDTASPLFVGFNGIITQRGIIERMTDADVFSFTTARGGSVLVSAIGLGNQVGNLDLRLDLITHDGTVLGSSKFTGSLGAGLSLSVIPGTYYLRVQSTNEGDPKTTGYTRYGSRGAYTLAGRVPF